MVVRMIATDKHPRARAGAEIGVSNSCVRFFREHGWAVDKDALAAPPERTAPAAAAEPELDATSEAPAEAASADEVAADSPQDAQAPAAAAKDETMPDIDALRDAYEKATGNKANPNWKAETLARKIEEAGGGTYQRRDMRAED